MNDLPWDNNSWKVAAEIAVRRSRQNVAVAAQHHYANAQLDGGGTIHAVGQAHGVGTAQAESRTETPTDETPKPDVPQLLLQTVVNLGDKNDDGRIIEAVALPWFDIIEALKKNWSIAYEIDPRKWEEIVAGAYKKAGYDVTLTPSSGDRGRDVIATKKTLGSGFIRVIDQVKAYKPPHLVPANDVRAMLGVLHGDGASKGFVSTTSDFAPKIITDPLIKPFIPARIELINGADLLKKLDEIARRDVTG